MNELALSTRRTSTQHLMRPIHPDTSLLRRSTQSTVLRERFCNGTPTFRACVVLTRSASSRPPATAR